jgi:hypothetical protein
VVQRAAAEVGANLFTIRLAGQGLEGQADHQERQPERGTRDRGQVDGDEAMQPAACLLGRQGGAADEKTLAYAVREAEEAGRHQKSADNDEQGQWLLRRLPLVPSAGASGLQAGGAGL